MKDQFTWQWLTWQWFSMSSWLLCSRKATGAPCNGFNTCSADRHHAMSGLQLAWLRISILCCCLRLSWTKLWPFIGEADEVEDLHKLVDIEISVTLVQGFGVKLPLISKYLVHSWVDTSLVMESAGKLDDTEVPTRYLWDQGILLRFLIC